MKKTIVLSTMIMLIFGLTLVSALGSTVTSTGNRGHIGLSNDPVGHSSSGGNHRNYIATHQERGTPGCWNPKDRKIVSPLAYDGELPTLSEEFLECSKLHANHYQNKYRDFGNAVTHWRSYIKKERTDGFNEEFTTYKHIRDRALNR